MGQTKNCVFKSSGRLDWTNTSNCVFIDYYSLCPCCAYRQLTEAYQYVITARLQSDPVKRRFSRYGQMSGGRFLNNLREVLSCKRILWCSLIKENKVNTGYVAKELIKRSHCESYKVLLKAIMPSNSLTDLLCYPGFRLSATFVLRCYGPESDFIRVNYLDWGFNLAIKITVNIFFNNRQTAKRYCLQGKCYWF